jgi:hypothetical protein
MVKRWRQARKERRFIRTVAPLISELDQFKAATILRVIAEDVRTDNIWPRDELRKGYEEMDDAGLQDLISTKQQAKAILWGNPSTDADAISAEIDRRLKIALDVKASRQH